MSKHLTTAQRRAAIAARAALSTDPTGAIGSYADAGTQWAPEDTGKVHGPECPDELRRASRAVREVFSAPEPQLRAAITAATLAMLEPRA